MGQRLPANTYDTNTFKPPQHLPVRGLNHSRGSSNLGPVPASQRLRQHSAFRIQIPPIPGLSKLQNIAPVGH